MAMLDGIISEVASRIGLGGEKAKQLVACLLSYITGPGVGGLSGFLNKIRNAGLGSILGGRTDALSDNQVKSLFGGEVGNIASRLGLSESATTSAISAALPSLLGKLAPGGTAPAHLPSEVSNLVQSVGGTVTDVSGRAVGAAAGAAQGAWNWLVWALPLIGVALLALWLYRSCNMPSPTRPTTHATLSPGEVQSTLSITRADGKVKATGVVPDAASQTALVATLKAAYGADTTTDIKVDPHAKSAGWITDAAKLLPVLATTNGDVTIEGNKLRVSGLPDAAKTTLSGEVKKLVGDAVTIE